LVREMVSADQHAYDYILGEIRSGRMAGGTRIKSEEIATAIGVSRIPVRGAMRQLESEGFITIRPNRGAVVTDLREQEAGAATGDVCRRHGISNATFYKWKAKYGGLDVSEARRLKVLEDENAKLKKLLAEAMLDNAMLKDISTKKF